MTTFGDLLQVGIPALNSTDQRAIAPPPICPLAGSLFSIAAERLRSAAAKETQTLDKETRNCLLQRDCSAALPNL
ncbi:hypothetical protein Lepto7375DRAFT_0235 [Leptolyngbya sp. PCC 7375]|nr:hypothetical protein Lepto7375DRAFT_0235 [Leptolyngbya sp. PCC 7375]